MKAKEVRKLTDEEVAIEARRLRRKLFDMRTQAVTEKITDTSQFGKLKRDIARVLTEQNRRNSKEVKA
jgi:large subunit ribosomal protein L29